MNTEKPTDSLPQNKIIWIELPEFELLCFKLARELYERYEPIPDFITRHHGILESCLETPRQKFSGKFLYPTLINQASILFYLLVKNHPFQNGNKRIALTTLLVFLALNGGWLKVKSYDLYKIAIKVAESKPSEKDNILKYIKTFVKINLIPLPKT